MAKRKNRINEVIAEMQAGLEKPEKMKGQKGYHLTGEFMTFEIEPTGVYDKAFAVNGAEEDRYCYVVSVMAIDTWDDEYNKIGRELSGQS